MVAMYAVVFLVGSIASVGVAQYWGDLTHSIWEQSQVTPLPHVEGSMFGGISAIQ